MDFETETSFEFSGVPAVLSSTSGVGVNYEIPPSPAGSDLSSVEPDLLSPSGITATGKRFWNDSSAWISSRISQSSYYNLPYPPNYRDPAAVERSNLLNITKLVIKELIEWSIRHGRSLDSDHPPLQHFFIVLEHALKHGLKPKKGLSQNKKELWDVLQLVERLTNDAYDITNSIRDLPTVSTPLGRARAWLKLALMQKKLADYFKLLVENRDDLLKDFYEPFALMNSEEAPMLAGLLVGLNIIDCNFCLKDEDLDRQQGVIDFSLYLRSSKSPDSANNEEEPQNNLDSVLDQKNYIEELNRHLNATVTSLQTKSENLSTTNALMKEDLEISKNAIKSLQDENRILKLRLDQFTSSTLSITSPDPLKESLKIEKENIQQQSCSNQSDERSPSGSPLHSASPPSNLSVLELSKKLHEERQLRLDLEKEVEMMTNQRAENQCMVKSMEKEIHEKQDVIGTLRRQLDDIKLINLEMYKKLQECEKSLKHKQEMNNKLESKASMLEETINSLDEKLRTNEVESKKLSETIRSLGNQLAEREKNLGIIEGDLRVEREWRQSLQDSVVKDKEKISELNTDLLQIQVLTKDLEGTRREAEAYRMKCREHEETLVDMGALLRASDLRMDQLKESSKAFLDAHWAKDKNALHCKNCSKEFSLILRKHHCRQCGEIFCKACSDNMRSLPSYPKPVRVCDPCSIILLERCSTNLPPIPPS